MTAISNIDVKNALETLRQAVNVLAAAITAQSQQVAELAEENQRLHDTVKNRDESIAFLRDRNESLKQANDKLGTEVNQGEVDRRRLVNELASSRRDCDELLRANIDAGEEIKSLRQLILDVSVTTARASEIGKRAAAIPSASPTIVDPASNYAG